MSDCINWHGAKTEHGYGRTTFRGKRTFVHRRAWILANGEIPDGLCVCHKCDNPLCINVDHLFIGTPKDNTQDCISKGRKASTAGSSNGMAKLTTGDVSEIRAKHASGTMQITLAREYGLSKKAVWKIVRGKSWVSDEGADIIIERIA